MPTKDEGAGTHVRAGNKAADDKAAGDKAAEVCRLAGADAQWNTLYSLMLRMLKPKRLTHSLEVADASVEMGRIFDGDTHKLAIAGLLHDGAKELGDERLLTLAEAHDLFSDQVEKDSPFLLHGPVASWLAAREWGIDDPVVLESIRLHTTGAAGMSKEACIVFLADLIEPGRHYTGVEVLRRLCREDLKAAMIEALEQTLEYLERAQRPLHGGTMRCLTWLNGEGSGLIWKARS